MSNIPIGSNRTIQVNQIEAVNTAANKGDIGFTSPEKGNQTSELLRGKISQQSHKTPISQSNITDINFQSVKIPSDKTSSLVTSLVKARQDNS